MRTAASDARSDFQAAAQRVAKRRGLGDQLIGVGGGDPLAPLGTDRVDEGAKRAAGLLGLTGVDRGLGACELRQQAALAAARERERLDLGRELVDLVVVVEDRARSLAVGEPEFIETFAYPDDTDALLATKLRTYGVDFQVGFQYGPGLNSATTTSQTNGQVDTILNQVTGLAAVDDVLLQGSCERGAAVAAFHRCEPELHHRSTRGRSSGSLGSGRSAGRHGRHWYPRSGRRGGHPGSGGPPGTARPRRARHLRDPQAEWPGSPAGARSPTRTASRSGWL